MHMYVRARVGCVDDGITCVPGVNRRREKVDLPPALGVIYGSDGKLLTRSCILRVHLITIPG